MYRKMVLLIFSVVNLLLTLSACSSLPQPTAPPQIPLPTLTALVQNLTKGAENPENSGTMLSLVDPAVLNGNIIAAGSSTVFPLAERMAERFQNEGFGGQITIDSIGSGAGFERFCVSGETDISNASRMIKESEVESCRSIGREPIPFRVGTDALVVTVSKENDFIQNVTLDQLAQIFSTAENWSDIDPSFPDEKILRYIPGTDSGTFDYFVEVIFDKNKTPILTASNTQLSEDDNVLIQGIEGSPYSIGFFGYAYYFENKERLNVMSIEGIAPSSETVDNNTYPLARPLFLYSDGNIMQSKSQVAGFINFFLTYVNEEIIDVGYFPASQEVLNQSKEIWLSAMGDSP